MADILPNSFDGIQNIKLLQHYKSILNDQIKRENNKLKVFNKRIIEISNLIEITDKQIYKIIKKNRKQKKYFCSKCAKPLENKDELYRHNCCSYYTTNNLLYNIVEKNKNCKVELIHYQKSYKDVSYSKYHLKKQLDQLKHIILTVSIKCQYCKLSNKYLEKCGCNFNHILCETCCEGVNDKCPICSQIINFEMCPICMNYKYDQIAVSCGNNHKICKDCLYNIMDASLYPRCPFCRIKIKNS